MKGLKFESSSTEWSNWQYLILGRIRAWHQIAGSVITWSNVGPDLRRSEVSPDHSELIISQSSPDTWHVYTDSLRKNGLFMPGDDICVSESIDDSDGFELTMISCFAKQKHVHWLQNKTDKRIIV